MPNDNTETAELVEEVATIATDTEESKPAEEEDEADKVEEKADKSTIAGGDNKEVTEEKTESVTYDFTESLPEGWKVDEESAKEFSEIAANLKLDNAQANQLASYGYQFAQKTIQAYEAEKGKEIEAWGKETVEKLGADLNKHKALCGVAVEALEKEYPDIRTILNTSGIGNKLPIVMAFSKLGEYLSQDNGKIVDVKGEAKANHNWYPNSNK